MLAKAIIAGLLTALFIGLPNKQHPPAQILNNQAVESVKTETQGNKQPSSVQAMANGESNTLRGSTQANMQEPSPRQPAKRSTDDLAGDEPEKPQAQTKVAVQAQVTGCENYRSLINQYDWDRRIAYAVMRAENTGCDSSATSPANYDGSLDRGLMQINSIHADKVQGDLNKLYTPTVNVSVAYRIYQESGWKAWSTYKSGKYLRYL